MIYSQIPSDSLFSFRKNVSKKKLNISTFLKIIEWVLNWPNPSTTVMSNSWISFNLCLFNAMIAYFQHFLNPRRTPPKWLHEIQNIDSWIHKSGLNLLYPERPVNPHRHWIFKISVNKNKWPCRATTLRFIGARKNIISTQPANYKST
jgi:hypothetical protein